MAHVMLITSPSPSSYSRPGFDIFLNIIFAGKCNTGIRTEPDMKPDEFIEGALHATSEVTGAMVGGNLVICVLVGKVHSKWLKLDINFSKESLEELMTSECLVGARENLRKLTPTQRVGLEVLKEDVIVSWVGKSMKNVKTGESRLLFAVTSLPAKGWIRNVSVDNTTNCTTLVLISASA